jgi:hypothetical protein
MTDPLTMSFEVRCPVEHAFRVWTAEIDRWWPGDHTVTGSRDVTVELQGAVGGRIFERTPDGTEHDWGEVTVWAPPTRLGYRWHLGRDRSEATDVEIRFVPVDHATTRVEIEHSGWDVLGQGAAQWRERNVAGWRSLLPSYRDAIASEAA